ncbi:MAG: hypothetical protein GYA69_00020 [Candidatus Moranbacteria bacterium]|nr:hypothetical protein [Candidatus Moranbacteria bacterium]
MLKIIIISLSLFIFLSPIIVSAQINGTAAISGGLEDGSLIKGNQPAVYYYYDNKRFAFPNEQIFYSWYGGFDEIRVIADGQLQEIPLGGNITFRPGVTLIKIQTDPKFTLYAMATN